MCGIFPRGGSGVLLNADWTSLRCLLFIRRKWQAKVLKTPEKWMGVMDILKALSEQQLKSDIPALRIGDTVKVHIRVKEGARERVQIFEGTIIAMKHGGVNETITVRRLSYGVGVEKVFPVHSPHLANIEVVRHGKVRRAKLYYLRGRVGKRARVKQDV